MPERSRTLSPGPKLDTLVAQWVMDWTLRDGAWYEGEHATGWGAYGAESPDRYRFCFRPSTEIAAGWAVVEVMRERFNQVRLFFLAEQWHCVVGLDREGYASTPTAPHAICLAALQACE